MPSTNVILVKDKWDTYTIDATDLDAAALKLLTERYVEGWWYDKSDLEYPLIQEAIDEQNGKLAWRILRSRADYGYEYEYVELQRMR